MSGNKNADELLKWGLQNAPMAENGQSSVAQVSDDIAAGRRPDLQDPALYEALMGKSEAQMMQEELGVAVDRSRPESDRLTALDNFEMLVEQVDNANNMESLQMWPALLKLLQSSDEPQIQLNAAWIVGTAMQNNDKAQVVALGHGILPILLSLLEAPTPELRSKAMYAISSLLGHYPAAVAQFAEANGWVKFAGALQDSSIVVRRKVAFLLNQLLVQDPMDSSEPMQDGPPVPETAVTAKDSGDSHMPPVPLEEGPATKRVKVRHPDVAQALVESGIFDALLTSLLPGATGAAAECNGQPTRNDVDYDEKALQVIMTLVDKRRPTLPLPKDKLAALVQALQGPPVDASAGAATFAQELGVEKQALDAFLAHLA